MLVIVQEKLSTILLHLINCSNFMGDGFLKDPDDFQHGHYYF
jgi:hypothetical protein